MWSRVAAGKAVVISQMILAQSDKFESFPSNATNLTNLNP
jgi:hypothetical protein